MISFRVKESNGVVNILRVNMEEGFAFFSSYGTDFVRGHKSKVVYKIEELSVDLVLEILRANNGVDFIVEDEYVFSRTKDLRDFKFSVWGTLRRIKKKWRVGNEEKK